MFKNYIKAGYPLLWVSTHEYERAIYTLSSEVGDGYKKYVWDITGLREYPDLNKYLTSEGDPLTPITHLNKSEDNTIVYALDFNNFIKNVDVFRSILNSLNHWKFNGLVLVIISPIIDFPKEMEKYITILDFNLPDIKVLRQVTEKFAISQRVKISKKDIERISNAGQGLTIFEFENSLSLSTAKFREFKEEEVIEQKRNIIRKNASLDFSNFDDKLENLGGMEFLKSFALKILKSPLARGILLLGVPGTGKSHFAKALGNKLGIPTISLDFGRIFGSLVGQSEGNIRSALEVVDAVSPCILFIDEIEKGISGIRSSHLSDGGTGSRVFGSFLTWLNDHKSRVFVIATCNDISKIPAEFLRSERWDSIFFVDLPDKSERNIILKIYKNMYSIKDSKPPEMEGWTGAEIKTLCRISKMLSIPLKEASKYIVPLSKTMREQIDALRNWAVGRTLPASKIETKKTSNKRRIEL